MQGSQKDQAEYQLIQALLQYWQDQTERIKAKLKPGIPRNRREATGPQTRLDSDFWADENRELLAVLIPALSDGSQDAAGSFTDWVDAEYGIGIDWTLVNADAVEWARRYAADLVKAINDTTREQINRHVSAWIDTPGATMGDLFAKLETLPGFDEARARMVAVTEITRAYAEGNKLAAKAYEDNDLFTWKRVWQTNNDDKVCPLCAPLHGTSAKGTEGEYEDGTQHPPRHPRCRCWETYEPDLEAPREYRDLGRIYDVEEWANQNYTGWEQSLSEEEKRTLMRYAAATDDYYDLNGYLRGAVVNVGDNCNIAEIGSFL